jgi:hypothetical protein
VDKEQLANSSGASRHFGHLLKQHLARAISLKSFTACANVAGGRHPRRTARVVSDESNTPMEIVTERGILQGERSGYARQTTVGELFGPCPDVPGFRTVQERVLRMAQPACEPLQAGGSATRGVQQAGL